MPAAYFLFAALQMVSDCGASSGQGIARGIIENRKYATLHCMRCCLCVKLQPRKILPGLSKAYHPETGCRAYEEKTRPYYAIEGKTAHFTGCSGRVSCIGKELIPNPVKMGFYCVTYNQNCIYEKTGRGGYHQPPRPVFLQYTTRLIIRNIIYNIRHYFLTYKMEITSWIRLLFNIDLCNIFFQCSSHVFSKLFPISSCNSIIC